MGAVPACCRGQADGTNLTQFVAHAGTTAIPYTYPSSQDSLEIWNKGQVNLILNVGTYTNQTIIPGQRWRNDVSFTNFDIKTSSGNGEYQATAYDYANIPLLNIKGTTANRPANAPIGTMYFDTTLNKPVWKKAMPNTWCDATGTTV